MPEDIKYLVLSEVVYQNIRESIIDCKYKSGQRLLLKKIADEMKVSITPVREAFKKLEKDGLIRIVPNNGAIVIVFTLRDVVELYDIRRQLECLAVELLTDTINKKILDELVEICDKSDSYLKKGNLNLYVIYNNEFHQLLVKSAQNQRLIKLYNEISRQLSILARKTANFPGKPKKSVAEHREIIKAMAQKNVELAKRLIQDHIKSTKMDILKEVKRILKKEEIDFNTKINKFI